MRCSKLTLRRVKQELDLVEDLSVFEGLKSRLFEAKCGLKEKEG
jgi:hypothetical protein